jgi:hypothetical protein
MQREQGLIKNGKPLIPLADLEHLTPYQHEKGKIKKQLKIDDEFSIPFLSQKKNHKIIEVA